MKKRKCDHVKNNQLKFAKNITANTLLSQIINKFYLIDHPFPKGTRLIVGDSILAGIDENRLWTWKHKVKVRYFPGARTDDLYDYMKPLLRKSPDCIILHIGTNDAVNNASREILDKILTLKTYIQKELLKCQITVSTPINRHGHGKASLTISHLCKKFKDLSISVVDNSNISAFYLNSCSLHFNDKGLGRLAMNLKLKVRKLWFELELMNDDHDKEMLDQNTSNSQGQKSLT